MPGPTTCPFCRSPRIRPQLPALDLCEYQCLACDRIWLVARPKRQAKIIDFSDGVARRRRQKRSSAG